MKRALAAALVPVAVLSAGLPAGASAADAARRGALFLAGRQTGGGAFFAPDQPADGTAETIASLIAGGVSGRTIERALDYLERHGPDRAREQGAYAGRIVMGIVAAGRDPRRFGGTDYVAILRSFYNPVLGTHDTTNLYADALAALGVLAAGERLPARAIDHFRESGCPGGGYSHGERCVSEPPDVDTTAVVVSALRGAGVARSDDAVAGARRFLTRARNADGGFGLRAGDPTNANSTGLALSAVAALGEDPRDGPWRSGGRDPVRALLDLQLSSGGFRYLAGQERPNDYATVQAVPGAAARAYPIRPVAGASARSAREPARARQADAAPGAVPTVRAVITPAPASADPAVGAPAAPGSAVEPAPRARPERSGAPAATWTAISMVVLSAAGVLTRVGRRRPLPLPRRG